MATFNSVWAPKDTTGGISAGSNATLSASGGTASFSIGPRCLVGVVVSGPVFIRFSKGASTATTSDFPLITGILYTFDSGDAFDTLSFLNNNGSSTNLVGVLKLRRT